MRIQSPATCPIWLKKVTTLADVTHSCRSLPPLPFSTLVTSVLPHKATCIPWQFYTTQFLVSSSGAFTPRSVCVACSKKYLKSRRVRTLSIHFHSCTSKVFGQAMGCVLWALSHPPFRSRAASGWSACRLTSSMASGSAVPLGRPRLPEIVLGSPFRVARGATPSPQCP